MGSSNRPAVSILGGTIVVAAGVGALWIASQWLRPAWWTYRRAWIIKRYYERMQATPAARQAISADFTKQLKDGLAHASPKDGKHMMMLPTFVTHLPNGHEVGDCFAMDIGGTNFRVMYARLGEDKSHLAEMDVVSFSIPPERLTGTGVELFDFMAMELSKFIRQHADDESQSNGRPPVVGFCFSFPCVQTSLNCGSLIEWTKGFECDGVVGHDPVQLLGEAMIRAGLPCNITALVNDAVAVLAAGRYLDADTEIGIIVGTGTNACYVEKVGNLTKWQSEGISPNTRTVVNIEWGAFESASLPRVEEDFIIDAATLHNNRYMFEKLMGGMFMGEIARQMLLTLCTKTALFGSLVPPAALRESDGFPSSSLSRVVDTGSADWGVSATLLRELLHLAPDHVISPDECKAVYDVCYVVGRRSAQLMALVLVALLRQTGWFEAPKRVVVVVDGGVYEKFAGFRQMLTDSLRDELGPLAEKLHPLVQFRRYENASCLGAAVVAAAASTDDGYGSGVLPNDVVVAAVEEAQKELESAKLPTDAADAAVEAIAGDGDGNGSRSGAPKLPRRKLAK